MASLTDSGKINYKSLGLKFELDDGYVKFENLLENLPNNLKKGVRDGSINFLRRYQDVIEKAVSTSGASIKQNWKLSEKYESQKVKEVGSSQPIFKYHGTLINSLRLFVRGNQVSFGVPSGLYNPETGMEVATYAHIVEFGSQLYNVAITPKPLFGPAFKEAGGTLRLRKEIVNEITNNLRLGQSFYIR